MEKQRLHQSGGWAGLQWVWHIRGAFLKHFPLESKIHISSTDVVVTWLLQEMDIKQQWEGPKQFREDSGMLASTLCLYAHAVPTVSQ